MIPAGAPGVGLEEAVMAELEQLRAAHMARALELAPEFCSRLRWTPDQLAAHQRQALRSLLATAVDRSPWHRKRLKGIDLDAVDPSDLSALPTMTKAELMADWDDIVTDDRLRLADVNEHLADAGDRGYMVGQATPMATGGSTGHRGVTVFDREGLAIFWLTLVRRVLIDLQTNPALRGGPLSIGWIGAAHPSHASGSVGRIFHNPAIVISECPVSRPVEQMVAMLNEMQPTVLASYPSVIGLLAREARVGRLRIDPVQIWCGGEPLTPELRQAAESAWGGAVVNGWGATEVGFLGFSCRLGRMHLNEDVGIVEVVDAEGRPVPPGVTGAKLFVTNLFNHLLPTIRYEISDEVTVEPDACSCGETTRTISDVQGRLDDVFYYGDTPIHPHVFRTAFTRRGAIPEYQVRQTARGADVEVCVSGELDSNALAAELSESLRKLGLADPNVTINQVERVGRHAESGKLKRFVPLAAS